MRQQQVQGAKIPSDAFFTIVIVNLLQVGLMDTLQRKEKRAGIQARRGNNASAQLPDVQPGWPAACPRGNLGLWGGSLSRVAPGDRAATRSPGLSSPLLSHRVLCKQSSVATCDFPVSVPIDTAPATMISTSRVSQAKYESMTCLLNCTRNNYPFCP